MRADVFTFWRYNCIFLIDTVVVLGSNWFNRHGLKGTCVAFNSLTLNARSGVWDDELALAVFIPPSIPPSTRLPYPSPIPSPPAANNHLLASHHQCSQGDERHGEEGPQGINFSHGWESSSQKTWQPQTAWLKKKRREEERGREGTGGGEEGEFFTWWPWERDFGYWVSFFSYIQSPHVLVWEWANCSSCSLGSPCVRWPEDVGGHSCSQLTPHGRATHVL